MRCYCCTVPFYHANGFQPSVAHVLPLVFLAISVRFYKEETKNDAEFAKKVRTTHEHKACFSTTKLRKYTLEVSVGA